MSLLTNGNRLLLILVGFTLFGCERNVPPTPARSADQSHKRPVDVAADEPTPDGQQVSFATESPAPPARDEESEPRHYPSTGIKFWDPPTHDFPAQTKEPRKPETPRVEPAPITPAEERRAIAVTAEYLKEDFDKPMDAKFKVLRADKGYRVFVEFFCRDEQGQPVYAVGSHCLVMISEDWKVINVVGGL